MIRKVKKRSKDCRGVAGFGGNGVSRRDKKRSKGSVQPLKQVMIQKVDMNIDYDKLAQAIVKANRVSEEQNDNNKEGNQGAIQGEQKKYTPKSFLIASWHMLKGDLDTQGEVIAAPFAILITLVFRLIAIAGLVLAVAFIVAMVNTFISSRWTGWEIIKNVLELATEILLFIAAILYSIILWGASNEVRKEKDRGYVISVFSGIVSFAALIVALISLRRSC